MLSRFPESDRVIIERNIRSELRWCDDFGSRFDLTPAEKLAPLGSDGVFKYPLLAELRLDAVHWPDSRFSIRWMLENTLERCGITLYYNIQIFDDAVVHSLTGDQCLAIISFTVLDETCKLVSGLRMPGIAYAEFVQSLDRDWTHYQYGFDDNELDTKDERLDLYRTTMFQFVLGMNAARLVSENEESLRAASAEGRPTGYRIYSGHTPHTARVATSKLRSIIETAPTIDIVSFAMAIMIMDRKRAREVYGLSSPYRQAQFLLGLLSATPDPIAKKEPSDNDYDTIARLLEAIFSVYAREIFAFERNGQPPSAQEIRDVLIAGSAIVNHYMSGRLATVEQTKERIRGMFAGIQSRVEATMGLRTEDMLLISDWIIDQVLDGLKRHVKKSRASKRLNEQWVKQAEGLTAADDPTALSIFKLAQHAAAEWVQSIRAINMFSRSALLSKFGIRGATFLQRFVTSRGDNPSFSEITERNPIRFAPLFAIDADAIVLPLGNSLYDGLLDTLTEVGRKSFPESYAKARGRYVERRVQQLFIAFFPARATILLNCFQDTNLRDEHDVVILFDRTLYVCEVKGTPPVSPPPDARRAAVRLERLFRSDRGIQYGYDQTCKVLDVLASGETIRFYGPDRALILELAPDDVDRVFAIVVTGEDFGALACDLSTLLEKPPNGPYPWAVNLYDLESFLDGFRLRDWGVPQLAKFLEEREGLHGRIIATDELDVAGAFLRYGSYNMLPIKPDTKIQMQFGDIFDEIYVAAHGGPEVTFEAEPPEFLDLRAEIERDMGDRSSQRHWESVTGDDPCPCGSSLRYKDCHGSG
jgi:hypothetical protein